MGGKHTRNYPKKLVSSTPNQLSAVAQVKGAQHDNISALLICINLVFRDEITPILEKKTYCTVTFKLNYMPKNL